MTPSALIALVGMQTKSSLEFGISLPTIGMGSPSAIKIVAEQAESAGLDSVWAADHIVLPTGTSSYYPYDTEGQFLIASQLPFLDQFSALSYVAGITSRIKLGTAVTLVPLRHPLALAKTTASIDVLSDGRFIFGVAAGWLEEEFTALGLDFRKRGPILDESLDVIMKSWTCASVDHQGPQFNIEGAASFPHPIQDPHPPIWVGGHTKVSMHRAARLGATWFPPLFQTSPAKRSDEFAQIREMAESYGHTSEAVSLSLRVLVDLREEPNLQEAEKRWALCGPASAIVETLAPYLEIGVSHMVFLPQARTVSDVQRTIDLLASEVIPALRGPWAK